MNFAFYRESVTSKFPYPSVVRWKPCCFFVEWPEFVFKTLVCGEQTYHISFCHLSPSTLSEGLGAGQFFWSIRLWKPWIILSSWMKARLFHSAKKALKNEHKWKRIYSVAQRGEHILTEFIFSLWSVCDFIAWARGRSGAVSCSKDNRASYSKHKHVLRMKDAFLKRETRPRS